MGCPKDHPPMYYARIDVSNNLDMDTVRARLKKSPDNGSYAYIVCLSCGRFQTRQEGSDTVKISHCDEHGELS